ncbi:FG-GAP-like repeat-containing protein [Hyalangium rubrum]|uniref:FG-GAP-like repeat-containing protein n=1 Tax=Hyalangium rubrum TaxID=3103134 RepID=A0ABU5H0V6_9BACT|nr:FG-GAP-like repeat-containing protein [Hyalangium sp. s54d21]MDY7227091.1 FG-GAP-like repeat-containing protein [Hyalangium sp. s54d21]
MSRLLARSASLFAFLTLACGGEEPEGPPPEPPVVDACDGLAPLALKAEPTRLRVSGVVALTASGGSGHYRFRAEAGGSSGEMRGDRFIAGHTPSSDTLVVEDVQCTGSAQATVQVLSAFDVAPSRAMVRPGTSFQVATAGLLGNAEYTLVENLSGGTLSPAGVYTAGATSGLDVVQVRDTQSGDVARLEYEVTPSARLRGDPQVLALPSGSSTTLGTMGGSNRVTWTKVTGPGSLEGARVTLEPGARGVMVLEAADPFTGDKARVSVRVLDDLTRTMQPRGRLTDVAHLITADFDGDGIQDVAVGQRESDLNRPLGGAVFIYKGGPSGLPQQPTWVLTGQTDTAAFGDNLAAGDLDKDGRAELAVSSPGADITGADSGAVYLYRWGSNGPELMRPALTSLARGGAFSTGLAMADADGDGDLDLIVSAPAGDLAPTSSISRRGTVDIFTLTPGQPVPDLPAIRLGGADLSRTGNPMARSSTDLGRAVVMADFNADGRVDLAALSKVSRHLADGTTQAVALQAVSVFFGRADGLRFRATPDVYVVPGNTADSNEGTWRLGVAPADGTRPPLLMAVADRADSPNLSTSGGVQSGPDSGGVLIFDLSAHQPSGEPSNTPVQVLREAAYARIYGEAGSIFAGRSFTVMDVDGQPGGELVLGAPNAAAPGPNNTTLRLSGRVLAYPLATLAAGSVINKSLGVIHGQTRSDVLGVGMTTWTGPAGAALVAFSGRASSDAGAFTGRVETFLRGGTSLAEWSRTVAPVPARPAVERFGEVVAAAALAGGQTVALVGSPGYAGPGPNADGADTTAGRAWVYNATQNSAATMVAEGASTAPLARGRSVGTDVTFTDFNGDGRTDLVVGANSFSLPSSGQTAELALYAAQKTGCITTTGTSAGPNVGGLMVSLGQADGSFKDAYRLWAPLVIAGCTPDTDARCRRSQIGRGVVGGFDFNGDGREDIGALRNNGFEVFPGRAPDDASLAKLTMGCDPLYFTDGSTTRQTSAPTALGDLNGDGCDEVSWRYTETGRSGIIILFGYEPAGGRCGGRTTASWVRLAADAEVGGNNLGMGVATVRLGNFLKDGKDRIAISATSVPFDGVTQPAVLLFETSKLVARRPASGEALVGALGDGVTPETLVHRTRAVNFGRALEGGRDLTGDGVPDLVVSAPGASEASDGGGAVFIYAGGPQVKGRMTPWMLITGDTTERSNFGQDLSLSPGGQGGPPTLIIGAPTSYRTGTSNGTAFSLPLAF